MYQLTKISYKRSGPRLTLGRTFRIGRSEITLQQIKSIDGTQAYKAFWDQRSDSNIFIDGSVLWGYNLSWEEAEEKLSRKIAA